MNQSTELKRILAEKASTQEQINLLENPSISLISEIQNKIAYLKGYLEGLTFTEKLLTRIISTGPDDQDELG